MREILFRAKRLDNNQWVEGYYVRHQKRMLCPICDELKKEDVDHFIFFDGFADWNMPQDLMYTKVNPDTLGQYIGMVDNRGHKIFEGDILKIMGYESTLTVEWWILHCGFGFGKGTLYCDETESNMIEVVGNIYDNHELMEE